MDVLLLMSGGVDSTACAHFFKQRGDNVRGVFVDYGQSAAIAERRAVKRVTNHLGIPLSTLSFRASVEYGLGEVVGRNAFLVFASLMGIQPRTGVISLGIHSGTSYYDCGPDFIEQLGDVVQSYSGGLLKLYCPFLLEPKSMVHQYAIFAGLPINLTYSCELGTVPSCGRCLSCKDRDALQAS